MTTPVTSSTSADKNRVFVIHGRNHQAVVAMTHFLRSLGLNPLTFDEVSSSLGGGPYILDVIREGMRKAFGVIALFTPDELAALLATFRKDSDKDEEKYRYQARPNVIFEAGFAIGMDHDRSRVLIVRLGHSVSLFSDIAGIHEIRLTNSTKSQLRRKLIDMGCGVNTTSDDWLNKETGGDFEGCVAGVGSPADPFRT